MISNQAQGLICNDGSQAPNAYFTEIICYSDDERKIDCSDSNIACAGVRVDINTLTKTILLVAGMLFGYFLFPQYEKKANAVESNSTWYIFQLINLVKKFIENYKVPLAV